MSRYKAQEGIFVRGEIIQMHTILDSNCTIIKLPRNGILRRKKINKVQFSLWKLSSATEGKEPLDDFYTDHPFVDWYTTTQDEGHSQHFSKRISFWTWRLSFLRMQLNTNMFCKMLRVYEWPNQKWLGIYFLLLPTNDIHFVLKILVANVCRLITPQTYPGHGRCVTFLNFNCVWSKSKSKVLLKLCIKLLTLV